MFRNNDWLIKSSSIIFFLGLLGLLLFYFDSSLAKVGLLLLGGSAAGLFFGMVIKVFFSYLNPADWLYQYRYTLEGIGWGLMFASIILAINLADNQPFGAMDLVLPLIFGPVFGVMWINTTKHKKLKNWTNSFAASNSGAILCNDIGSLIDGNNQEKKGMIMLAEDSIIFNPFREEQRMKINLSEINPQLEKSWFGFFKTPSGIKLTNEQSIEPAKFPRYWLQKIRNEEKDLPESG
jgi:hypothetical protein